MRKYLTLALLAVFVLSGAGSAALAGKKPKESDEAKPDASPPPEEGKEEDEEDPTPPELKESIANLMIVVGDMFSRMTFQVNFTERGVELPATVVLSD